jgi:YidC/Oxa1 family membrane protein insertase
MQQRNVLLFLVLVFGLLLGWMQIRERIWPTPKQAAKPAPKAAPKGKAADPDAEPHIPALTAVTPDDQLIVLGSTAGNSPFHLGVKLDPLGGGVRSVTLNKFKAADSGGLPVPGEPLELVPDAYNRQVPAYALYHFEGDKNRDHPLDTLGRTVWKVVSKGPQSVTFRAEAAGVVITKTYTLEEGSYHLGLAVTLERPKKAGARDEIKFAYQLAGARGQPVEGKWYTGTFRNALILKEDDRRNPDRKIQELPRVALMAGGDPVVKQGEHFIRYAGVALQYFASVIVVDDRDAQGEPLSLADQAFLERARPTLETAVAQGKVKEVRLRRGEAAATVAGHFVLSMGSSVKERTFFVRPADRHLLDDLSEGQSVAVIFQHAPFDPQLKACPLVATDVRTGTAARQTHALWEDDITVRVVTEPVELKPGDRVEHRYLLYHGPVKPSLLGLMRGDARVDPELVERYSRGLQLNTMTDYQSDNVFGWFGGKIGWSWLVIQCTNLMHVVLAYLFKVVPSYLVCIILLTVLVRGLMFPVSRRQAIMGVKMQALAPEIKKLAEKHKDDLHARQQAQMELFRKHGVHPLGSCWFILLQMPIFMGLYYCLQESIFFRLAPAWPTWIPWIQNLAAPDMLFRWGEGIPLLSTRESYGSPIYLGPYFNLLPILAVALMLAQQKMMTPPAMDEQQEMQQKVMKFMMIFMGLFFYKVAAGLCVYFIASSLWGFAERKLLPKAKKGDVPVAKAEEPRTGGGTSGASPTGITTAGGVTTGRKLGRNKRKGGQGAAAKQQEPDPSALGRVRRRLADWWNDVLEQARKK